MVRLLLGRGADPNLPDGQGGTPLMGAVETGCVECLHMLLEAKASINTTHPGVTRGSGFAGVSASALAASVSFSPSITPIRHIRTARNPSAHTHERRPTFLSFHRS